MLKSKKKLGIVAVLLTVSLLLCSGCGIAETEMQDTSDYEYYINDLTDEEFTTVYEYEPLPPKLPCTATVDDEFEDNQILVFMTRDVSLEKHTIFDFFGIGCVKLRVLIPDERLAQGSYKPLLLTLFKHSKQNVLDSIKKLEARDDVFIAEVVNDDMRLPPEKAIENDTRIKYAKHYPNFSAESRMVDNEVHISIQPYASMDEYTAEMFAHVGCVAIADEYIAPHGPDDMPVKIMLLTLDRHSKENVVRVCQILQLREDIGFAAPNFLAVPAQSEATESSLSVGNMQTQDTMLVLY